MLESAVSVSSTSVSSDSIISFQYDKNAELIAPRFLNACCSVFEADACGSAHVITVGIPPAGADPGPVFIPVAVLRIVKLRIHIVAGRVVITPA